MKYRKSSGIVLLALTLAAAARALPARHLFHSVNEFVCHYRTLEGSNVSTGFWEKVAVSLVLTTAGSSLIEATETVSPSAS